VPTDLSSLIAWLPSPVLGGSPHLPRHRCPRTLLARSRLCGRRCRSHGTRPSRHRQCPTDTSSSHDPDLHFSTSEEHGSIPPPCLTLAGGWRDAQHRHRLGMYLLGADIVGHVWRWRPILATAPSQSLARTDGNNQSRWLRLGLCGGESSILDRQAGRRSGSGRIHGVLSSRLAMRVACCFATTGTALGFGPEANSQRVGWPIVARDEPTAPSGPTTVVRLPCKYTTLRSCILRSVACDSAPVPLAEFATCTWSLPFLRLPRR
jgi:hypothetical protein